ncbi:MAG: hypothetical protein QQN55_07435 [Nitrosopumilus sp.]
MHDSTSGPRINEKPKKQIVFDSCLDCPLIEKCGQWAKLPKKTKVTLMIGVGVNVGILKTCPLDDHIS